MFEIIFYDKDLPIIFDDRKKLQYSAGNEKAYYGQLNGKYVCVSAVNGLSDEVAEKEIMRALN